MSDLDVLQRFLDEQMVLARALVDGKLKLVVVPADASQPIDRLGLRETIDRHIGRAREYGSSFSTEDQRQRYGREQGLQELRRAIFGERLP